MARIGVVLSGCGVFDGAEIHESVIALLALDRRDANIIAMAPNADQMHVLNHITGEEMDETRNVLVESSRIVRGDIKDMAEVTAIELDALIFPGGFGGAKNLSDFAVKGANATVNPEVFRLVKEMYEANKPIGFICITPASVGAKCFMDMGVKDVKLTIGTDQDTAAAMTACGAKHVDSSPREIVVDEEHKIVSTAAYMSAGRISEAAEGIEKLVDKVLTMI